MAFNKHIFLKLSIRLVLVLILLLLFNEIYKRYFWKDDLDSESPLLLDLQRFEDSADVIYFGESSNFSYNPYKDSLQDRISDFISYYYPGLKFGTINSGAIHAGLYLPLIQQIKEGSRVKTIIVTLNMRTFNQDVIFGEDEAALQKQNVMYKPRPPLLNRLFMTLNFYDDRDAKERDRLMWKAWTFDTLKSDIVEFPYPTIKRWCEVEKFPLPEGGEDMKKRELADHYIKSYAFQIKTDKNPRIADFDKIVAIAKKKDLNLVFNLLAENTEYADSLVGKNLIWLMKTNRDLLVKRYSKLGVTVVDNLEIVPGWDYTDQHWTTEHYGQYGRQLIAVNVSDSLKKFYPSLYKSRTIIK
jgi:hypothetical protein